MNINEYIESGVLELYVYGKLNDAEAAEVSEMLSKHPEVTTEVEAIEKAMLKLASTVAPYNPKDILARITAKLTHKQEAKVVAMPRKSRNTSAIIGWAASIALIGGLAYMINENNNLRESLKFQNAQNAIVTGKYEDASNDLENTKELLSIVRNEEFVKVPLGAQAVSKDAYAAVYWDTKNNKAYIDAKGLPKPPKGKVYQVWSLKLEPLTPTSIGLLEDMVSNDNLIFELDNPNASQAFGITLEPEGGSEGPSLDQLYVLGAVGS